MGFMGTPHPRAKIPVEISALEMAEAWGVPPWDIMEHEGSLRWMVWYKLYHAQLNKAKEEISKRD